MSVSGTQVPGGEAAGRMVPSTSRDERGAYRISPLMLPASVQGCMLEACLRGARERGITRVALFPAGAHSARLDAEVFARAGVDLVVVVDDVKRGVMLGRPIVTPAEVPAEVEAIVISSDAIERACEEAARGWCGSRVVLRPYAPLDDPSYEVRRASREKSLKRLAGERTGRLNLGCGDHPLEGWTNIDGGDGLWYDAPPHPGVIPLDVFEALAAIPNSSCTHVYSEHFFEHFTLEDGYRMAREWARVLRPGGRVRVVTPDLRREARMYLGEELPASPPVMWAHKRRWLGTRHAEEQSRFLTQGMLFQFSMRLDGHQFVYDEQTLGLQLQAAGFVRPERCAFGESADPVLRGIDRHDGGCTGGAWLKDIQLVMEATR